MAITKLRLLNPKSIDTKYTGFEPDWTSQPQDSARQSALMSAFTWYGYHYDKKTAKQLVLDWLLTHDAVKHKKFAKVPDSAMSNQLGWLCRMNQRGLVLNDHEEQFVADTITKILARCTESVPEPEPNAVPKVNIQDRLRAKAEEVAGELEGLYDDMIVNGAKMTADHKPIAVLRGMNMPVQLISVLRDVWESRLKELSGVQTGTDGAFTEGYSNFSKIQLRNLIKFTEQVLSDIASYAQIKKVEKKPRKAKAVSPEHRARKFRHITVFDELKLSGLPAAKLVDCSEAWLYDTKKRKLIHLVADAHIGSVTIKNNVLVGMGEADSQQKTLRKPADILRQLIAASKPNARRLFKDIKTTETAFNGRGTENLMILRVW